MVEVGTGTAGTRFLKTEWPVEEGLTAGTTKQAGTEETLRADDKRMVEGWGSL